VGITQERQKQLFKMFNAIDQADSLSTEGIGLGLTISKLLSERLGGWIKLSSAEGEGTTVIFSIKVTC